MSRLDETISDVAFILDNLILLRQIQSTGDCNICNNKGNGCPFEPKVGQMVRYNCPFYKAKSVEKQGCRCNTCVNNEDELSGECYECVKGIFDHYEKRK